MRVGLVGCVSEKRSEAAPAADLYTSTLFRGRRAWVERSCDRWFILSALHGLVHPAAVLNPYDLSLTDVTTGERRTWAHQVLAAIDREAGDLSGVVVEIHAGSAYRDHGLMAGLQERGAEVEVPMANLPIGKQLAVYSRRRGPLASPVDDRPPAMTSSTARKRSGDRSKGAYAPLSAHLNALQERARLTMTFAEVERVLGRPLPASARKHRPWWANSPGSHSHARSWLDAGWRVSGVDLNASTVTFDRGRVR